jgi:hypothetical protein
MNRNSQKQRWKSVHPRFIIWLLSILVSFCWSYALAVRFTRFFMVSLTEKGLVLGAFFLLLGIIISFIFHRYLPIISQRIHTKRLAFSIFVSIVMTAILLLVIFPPLYFPEQHTLVIRPTADMGQKDLTVINIQRIELPSSRETILAPSFLQNSEKWQKNGDNYPLSWRGDPDAELFYTRFMQAGLKVVLKTGPEQGIVEIIWDGKISRIDLESTVIGEQTLQLPPALNWSNLNPSWQILVGMGILAQWLGLFFFLVLAFQFPLIFSIRASAMIGVSLGVIFLLFPVVNWIDPQIDFKDPQLDGAVRLAVKRPDGDLRLHQLLTLAVLDASEQEITNLDGIERLRSLESLNLRNNYIADITPLENLTRLKELDLRGNQINDISPIAKLQGLESLNLRENPVEDIYPIRGLVNLRELNLHGVNVGTDIDVISNLKNLVRLNIRLGGVTDLSPLVSLMNGGALQDDKRLNIRSRVDIRDNPISRIGTDGYKGLRSFWENISERTPFQLPEFTQLIPPVFSHPGGFYPVDFPLEITTGESGASIHFTLDCSEPTQKSPLYTEPVPITENSGNCPNLAMDERMSPQWQPPIGQVDRAVIVRARVYISDGSHSPVVTQTYFIGKEFESKYSLPIVSLTTDSRNLLDYEYGIYTLGRVQDIAGGLSGNYSMQGAEWERPANFEYYDESRRLQISQKIGFRVHGATTRSYTQKSLRLYASDIYDDARGFTNIFFGNQVDYFNKLLLRNSGNNRNFPMFRDNLLQSLVSHTSLDIHAYKPVNVFLNGEYWGIYNLREYLDEEFLAARHELDPRKIVMLENDGRLLVGKHGDEKQYQEMLRFINEDENRDPENYAYLNSLMDMENFIDYQIAQIYSRNENWPFDNIKYWRYKTDGTPPMDPGGQDGRWRWLLHDLDTAFGVIGAAEAAQDNTLVKAEGEFLFRSLLEYEQFRADFINRFADHLNTTFIPARVIGLIDLMASEINPDLPPYLNRWAIMGGSLDAWEANVQVMRDFAISRPNFLRQHIIDRFGLSGTAELTIIHDRSQGSVQINSIDLSGNTPGVENFGNWSGVYFKGIPIQITANPKPGFEFAGWEGIDETSPSVSITPKENLIIRAVFIPVQS